MHIIVDGYNLIRQSEILRSFERLGLETGRRELIRRLSQYKRNRGHTVTVVFDGWFAGPPIEEREREGGVTIIYSKRGERADEVIKRLACQGGVERVVVTSDRDLAHAVHRSGAAAIPAQTFEARLLDVGSRPSGDRNEQEEEPAASPLQGTKKKGPARRMSKKKKTDLTRIRKL
jgi:predicted RNA-binding protein with PIN domain